MIRSAAIRCFCDGIPPLVGSVKNCHVLEELIVPESVVRPLEIGIIERQMHSSDM